MMSRQEIQNYENDEEDGLLLARSIKISALRIKKKKNSLKLSGFVDLLYSNILDLIYFTILKYIFLYI
jgi:hypothetical protein